MPKPRFDFDDINRERLKKISLSASSLPPVALFSTEEKHEEFEVAHESAYSFHNSMENINDDLYNFFDDEREKRHHSLEYLDDFYPIEEHHFLNDPDDEDEFPQMTTTTTIASLKCQTNAFQLQQQTTTVTIFQTHNRASSL